MRKAALLAAILTATAAWGADTNNKGARTADQDANSAQASPARSQAAKGTGSAQTSNEANANATPNSEDKARAERDQLSNDDFSLKGTVAKVSGKAVTINRDNSTPATLEVDRATKIEVDGKAAQLSAMKPGDDLKAKFNLRGTRPIAVDLKASSKK